MPAEAVAIIPVAGTGTRLRPHTFTQPKVLLQVAGKPILAHILDQLPALGIGRAVLVVGYLGDRVREWVKIHYPRLKVDFVEQPERLGLGHAVSLAAPHAGDAPILVILGDTIFEADLGRVLGGGASAIGVKAVDDPHRFGIVETNGAGRVIRMVEKPEHPASNLAIAGIYYFTEGGPLFAALADLQARGVRTRGEFQLTDAMQQLIENGVPLETFPIEGWYDCGKTETLLETNRVLLDRQGDTPEVPGSVVRGPVAIAPDAMIERCILGPHVSIGSGARLRDAVVRDSIINEGARVEDAMLEGSVVGAGALVRCGFRRVNVGESSEVQAG
jgi:glucose-1-phosphate thymidylyltransferase